MLSKSLFILLALLFIVCPSNALPSDTEKRLALVIGNADYSTTTPLANPVNDARAIAKAMQHAGFTVMQYENMEQSAMKRVIAEFGRELTHADIGLFYYAGHGIQLNGRNYLVPVTAKIQYETDIEVESVDLALVLSKMDGVHNRLNIVILDACRNNPFTSNSRALNQGLAFTNAPSGTLIAYATAPGDVASDGEGENGIYTQYLIKHIETPGARIEDVFKNVRIDVKKATQNRQVPWESSSLEGDFYFYRGEQTLPSSVTPLPPPMSELPVAITPIPPKTSQLSRNSLKQEQLNKEAVSLNCSDLREKEAFSGSMGFSDLTPKELDFLAANCS